MSTITIYPSELKGKFIPPASKSCTQRVCAAALLKTGKTIISNYGNSNDEKTAIQIIQQLGAVIEYENDKLIVTSNFSTNLLKNTNIFCNESGLSLRMFTIIAALIKNKIKINAKGSLLTRPINFFEKTFQKLNVKFKSTNGIIPFEIEGPLVPKNIEIDGSISSQFLTGLLMAYSSFNEFNTDKVIIKVNNLKSKPYIDLTLKIIEDFGLNSPKNNDYKEFIFSSKNKPKLKNSLIEYTIEGDWSNAAFFLVAAALKGNLTIKGLNLSSFQADKKILEVLKSCGVEFIIKDDEMKIDTLTNKKELIAFDLDATDCPDLFPPLVCLAANCKGQSRIKGIHRLIHKESNRAKTLQMEFAKMGVTINFIDDFMLINGAKKNVGATVNSHNDHRIAMACAITALNAEGKTTIENAEAVNKSYPDFFSDLEKLGVQIKSN